MRSRILFGLEIGTGDLVIENIGIKKKWQSLWKSNRLQGLLILVAIDLITVF